ncbi:MAG: DUF29 domain-containing protein, partial [Gemmataceae bacterium]
MSLTRTESLPALYEQDETAWLEVMADLIAQRRFADLDTENLVEYLTSMARSEKREVYNRLVTLLTHLLKWEHQPDKRSGSWRGTVREQRRQLNQLLESGTLHNHAVAVFADAYADARKQCADETELPIPTFPAVAAFDLDAALDPEA